MKSPISSKKITHTEKSGHVKKIAYALPEYISLFLTVTVVAVLLFVPFTASAYETPDTRAKQFADVPKSSRAYDALLELKEAGIIPTPPDNKYRPGAYLKRGDFVIYLTGLMGWEQVKPSKNTFTDVRRTSSYYPFVEAAVLNGAVSNETKLFKPNSFITKAELAEMLVKAMGYEELAAKAASYGMPYTDLDSKAGYAMFLVDTGIIKPKSSTLFGANDRVKREDAALILFNAYQRLKARFDELHAFYATDSSSQMEYIRELTSVSFGWSRIQYDKNTKSVFLNTSYTNGNDFAFPPSFSKPVSFARDNGVTAQLNVIASQETKILDERNNTSVGLVEYIISNPDVREKIIRDIASHVISTRKGSEEVSFDGVVIDFEGLKGEQQKNHFTVFLQEMKKALEPHGKKLYVAVHPVRYAQPYYDGYDYAALGKIADKVILMAHDYDAKSLTQSEMDNGYTYTPLTPIDEIYYALKAVTDSKTGVGDTSKIWLQINFATVQWQIRDGKVTNRIPYYPYYYQLKNRILNEETADTLKMEYDAKAQNPYITFTNKAEGIDNRIWYEDSRSVLAKLRLASTFGIKGVSIWRLGNIPDFEDAGDVRMHLNVWQEIINLIED